MRRLSYILILLLFAGNLFAQSPHGKDLKIDCSNCHSSASWKEIPKDIKFDHSTTGFELNGQHKDVSCIDCHKSLVFSQAVNDCSSCHKSIHQNSVSPECSSCHTTQNWLVTNINELHQRSRFPLVGAHAMQDCASCHLKFSSLNFEVQGVECVDCHRNSYMSTQNPNHIQAGFSSECQQCHQLNQTNWGLSNFVHEFFPLVGGHNIKNCFACHQQGKFAGLSKDCYTCHRQNYEATTNPNHVQGKFSTDCVSCHTINGWKPANFDHNLTGFPLIGMHKTASCNSCHSAGYTNLSTECYACHKANYDGAVNPNHVTNNFPTTCEQCHTPGGWSPSTFDHNSTAFPLTGAHVNVNCASCHVTGYTGTSTDCYSCHKANYDGTTDPNHAASAFPTDCKQCHTTTAWKPANFDHNTTAFPLTGAHVNVTCSACHATGYTGTPTDCYSCHKSNFDATTDPNHAASGYPTDCTQCHTTSAWKPANFDHNTTAFPLTGAHVNVTCSSCHANGFAGTPTACYSCHKSNYDGTTDPNHAASGFPTDCTQCHTTSAWKPSTFDHNTTAFPLTGAHVNVTCSSCHANGFAGTPTACYSCHKSNYDGTTDPNHAASGFSTDCTQCHTTSAWKPATFDHNSTAFPLTGQHTTLTCTQCHASGYAGTPTDCYSCHKSNYDNSTNPNHLAASFPTDCAQCHTTNGWTPSTFDHDNQYFPIYSGKHNGRWNTCADCHTDATNYAVFTCIDCHEHNKTDTDDQHRNVSGYVYASSSCYSCHPRGSN